MKAEIVVLLFGTVFGTLAQTPDRELVVKALATLDSMNMEELVGSNEKVQDVFRCTFGQGTCDEFGSAIKLLFPIVSAHGCAACSNDQKRNLIVMATGLKYKYPEYYQSAINQYFNGEEPPFISKL